MMGASARPARRVTLRRVRNGVGGAVSEADHDVVAAEEPLQIRLLAAADDPRAKGASVAITMRTPGHDIELAAGFLFSEGIVRDRDELLAIRRCSDEREAERDNILKVHLRTGMPSAAARLERHFAVTSACGVCGKAHLDALETRCPVAIAPGPTVANDLLLGLPAALRAEQTVFGRTGGLHAAGLFSVDGTAIVVREDVGRHNALDKVLGWALLEGRLPLADHILCVSGRASFELAQKAVMAAIPVLCAVSAPSSLAVEVAQRFGVTLVGFLRDDRFNVYCGEQRLERERPATAIAAD